MDKVQTELSLEDKIFHELIDNYEVERQKDILESVKNRLSQYYEEEMNKAKEIASKKEAEFNYMVYGEYNPPETKAYNHHEDTANLQAKRMI